MVLPQGFKYAKDFTGVEKDDKTFIRIYDPYESDYNTSSAAFSRPMFENKGLDVFTFKTLNVGRYPAKYAGMKSSTGYKNYELVFGDTNFSTMLYGHCSVNDETAGKSIEDAILSIKYDNKIKADPYVHGYFTLAAIQGLKGKAENGERMIRAYGLGAYLAEEVRRLSKNHQEPEFNSGLGDVGIVKH